MNDLVKANKANQSIKAKNRMRALRERYALEALKPKAPPPPYDPMHDLRETFDLLFTWR